MSYQPPGPYPPVSNQPTPGYPPQPSQPQAGPSGAYGMPSAPQAGPGGAYGPMPGGGAPAPGQAAAPQMSKPGSITAIQAILWTMSVISALGELFSIITLIDYFHPIGLVAVVVAGFFTVKSIIAPIYIGRGRRWAWILALVGAILGTLFGTLGVVSGLAFIDDGPLPLLIGLAFLALYVTLLCLLCTSSARMWITSNRVLHMMQAGGGAVPGSHPGQVPGQAVPGQAVPGQMPGQMSSHGADPQAVAAAMMQMMQRDPNKKPGSLTAAQVMLWIWAVGSIVMAGAIWLVRADEFRAEYIREWFPEYYPMLATSTVSTLVLVAICVGLAMKSSWAGIGSLVGAITAFVLHIATFILLFVQLDGADRVYYTLWEGHLLVAVWTNMILIPVALTALILCIVPSGRRWITHVNASGATPTGPDQQSPQPHPMPQQYPPAG